MKKIIIFFMMAISITSACTLTKFLRPESENLQQTVEAKVEATLMAMKTERAGLETEATPTEVKQTPAVPTDPTLPATGTIMGDLGFPSEYIPPLRVVAFNIHSDDYFYVDTLLNQSEYQMELPPGTYHVVAYVREDGPDFEGGYSYFVTCGMTVDCNNHELIDVWVYAGQTVSDVSPIDFYAFPDEVDWPANPTE